VVEEEDEEELIEDKSTSGAATLTSIASAFAVMLITLF
jgi:hypothetical protein